MSEGLLIKSFIGRYHMYCSVIFNRARYVPDTYFGTYFVPKSDYTELYMSNPKTHEIATNSTKLYVSQPERSSYLFNRSI
jgi:hypothetical protein